MVVGKGINQLARKQDLVQIAILLAIALGIGIYLIVTTVLIAKDGVSYINYAKGLATTPLKIIRDCSGYAPRSYTPGYPFLILAAHAVANLFEGSSLISSWIYAGQSVSLLCRMLTLLPLYFIGKRLVGPRSAFWGLLILVFLPYPAEFGSDVLRDWPHMLFLTTGFLLLVRAAMRKRWWQFGLVGIVAALGYTIRPICGQLVIYGVLWLVYILFKSENEYSMPRLWTVAALGSLIVGFATVITPYTLVRGNVLPVRARQIMHSFSYRYDGNQIPEKNDSVYQAEFVPAVTTKALWELIDEISANLMYFFAPFLFVGIYHLLCNDSCILPLKFMLIVFVLLNIVMLILRYVCAGPALSRRYVLPITAFTIFAVPIGLQVFGDWIDKLLCKTVCKNDSSEVGARRWFFVLLIIGLGICIPKLFRPIRIEKEGYQLAAEWLKRNTNEDSVIAVSDPDPRIAFYSERKAVLVPNRVMPQNADFAVKMYKGDVKPIYVDGVLTFNGIDDYVDLGANPIPSSGDFSISGWVYCDGEAVSDTDRFGTAFGSGSWSGTAIEGIVIRRSSDGFLRVTFGDGSDHHNLVAVSNITTTNRQKWYHIVVVRKSSEFEVYANGESVGSVVGGYVNSGVNFRIGHSGKLNDSQAYWYGRVKNVRVYDKALSVSEVLDLYSANNNLADSPEEYILNLGKGKKKTKLVIYRLPLIRTFSF